MSRRLQRFVRHLRWLAGRGWNHTDFSDRYRERPEDAWGYEHSKAHLLRHERILASIPEGRIFRQAFEAGCAEGHLTVRLVERADRVFACDLSPEAVARTARRTSLSSSTIEVVTIDLREEIPLTAADLIVYSDALYYLSPGEISKVMENTGQIASSRAILVFANEWTAHYKGMPPPEETMRRIEDTGGWRRLALERFETGDSASLTVATYERLPDLSSAPSHVR